jgi:uncharacterized iron-regulated membrane protein
MPMADMPPPAKPIASRRRLRTLLLRLHRWSGLGLAAFLLLAGLTGSLIVFNQELDVWLNPGLTTAPTDARPLSPQNLAARIEQQQPDIRVSYLPFRVPRGQAVAAKVVPRRAGIDVGFDEVFADPATGRIQGRRLWGACCLSRSALMPFLYRLHHTLACGRPGEVLMGVLALLWLATLPVGAVLALPGRAPLWRRLLRSLRRPACHPKLRLAHDLHRATGMWFLAIMPFTALTGAAMALEIPLTRPALSLISPLAPVPADHPRPCGTPIGLDAAIAAAEHLARDRDWAAPAGAIFDDRDTGEYAVYFYPGPATRGRFLGSPTLHIDACTGALRAAEMPGQGSLGDILLQARFPLHSGQWLGLPGRLLIMVTGLAVPLLAASGVLLWALRRPSAGRAA